MIRRAGVLILLVLCLSPLACRKQAAQTPASAKPNVLLIAVDTLRADRLGCYGSDLGATPRIDALAAESLRFAHAYAHAPWTLPSFASLLSSLTPPAHDAGGQLGQFRRLRPSVQTLPECFRDAGYATACIVNVDFLTAPFGLTQGFDHVDFETYPDNLRVRDATRTTDAAAEWLKSRPAGPFFLMVHYFDPHLVYAPPPEYRRRFADPRDRENTDWVFGTREEVIAYRRGELTFDDDTIRRAEQLYNGEVAYTDAQVGRLLDLLAELDLADNTIVVFTADHGEEFLDHGGFEHGHTLFDELVHIPLLLRWPGHVAPGVQPATVGHVDVAPTLCALTGVPAGPAFVGRDLLAVDLADRPILIEGNFWGPPLEGWLHAGHKLIITHRQTLLFALDTDTRERHDLATQQPERVAGLRADLELALTAIRSKLRASQAPIDLPPEGLERLRAVGYLR